MTEPHAILKQIFGFDHFRGVQEQVIGRVLAGEHTLAVMPTGAGKSLCYQLPALIREGTALVISPLIALMHDQIRSAEAIGLNAASLTSADADRDATVRRFNAGELDLLYVAPERATGEPFRRLVEPRRPGADRDRRSALRQRMGARFPARLSPASRTARCAFECSAAGADRHRRRAHPSRHPGAARHSRRTGW